MFVLELLLDAVISPSINGIIAEEKRNVVRRIFAPLSSFRSAEKAAIIAPDIMLRIMAVANTIGAGPFIALSIMHPMNPPM